MTDILAFIEARERDVETVGVVEGDHAPGAAWEDCERCQSLEESDEARDRLAALGPVSVPLARALVGGLLLVDSQAEDGGLWFMAKTAPEAYLQQELRKLHAEVESSRQALAAWAQSAQDSA